MSTTREAWNRLTRDLFPVDCLDDPPLLGARGTAVTAVIPRLPNRHAGLTSERGTPGGIVQSANHEALLADD